MVRQRAALRDPRGSRSERPRPDDEMFAVRETRIVESDDPVNYRYIDGRLESLTSEAVAPAQ